MQESHKWSGLRLEIAEYCRDNRISEEDFRFLGIYEWRNVYDKVLEYFVDEQYARRSELYWSNIMNGFKKDINRIYSFEVGGDGYATYRWIEKLPEIVKSEKVYLLLEEDEQAVKYWIAECNPSVVHQIINESIYLEDYYITDKKFKWLITQNHHDIVHFIGEGLDVNVIESVCMAAD